MKTTHLTSIIAAFNPFANSGAVPRLFLQLLPPRIHRDVKITQTVLPRSSTGPATLELEFKDGKKINWSWVEVSKKKQTAPQNDVQKAKERTATLEDVVEEVDRHTRVLSRKEELSG